jgi:hypothetical protein
MSTSNQTGIEDVITLSNISDYDSMLASSSYGSDTLTLSDLNSTVTSGGYVVDSNLTWPGNLTVGTISTAGLGLNPGNLSGGITGLHPNAVWSTNLSSNASGKLQLNGDNADIEVNGVSLMSLIDELKERLNWLTVNPELEAEWDELRELGERYRELEKQCKEKAEVWKKLKSMPPPVIP